MNNLLKRVKINNKFSPLKLKRMNIDNKVNFDDLKEKKEKIPINKAFDIYVNNILPNIQNYVETKILNQTYNKLDNELLKKELLLNYNKRQLLINNINENYNQKLYSIDEKQINKELKINVTYSDIKLFNNKLVGLLCNFGLNELQKYYKIYCFGLYFQNMIKFSKSFALMGTPEALKIINHLKRFENRKKVNYNLLEFNNYEEMIEEYNYKEEIFMDLIFELGETLRESIYERRFKEFYHNLFSNSFLFDDIILKTINSLYKKDLFLVISDEKGRKEYFDKYLDLLENNPDKEYFSSYNLNFIFKSIKGKEIKISLNGKEYLIDLKYTKNNLERYKFLPDIYKKYSLQNFKSFNSGILIHGFKGTGKSGLLAFITMHCYKNDYYIMKLPDIHSITHDVNDEVERHEESRLYLQEKIAINILRDFLSSHDKEFLKKFKIDKSIYGKYNVAGVHENEPNPVPNLYDPKRQAYFYDSDKFLTNEQLEKVKLNIKKYKIKLNNLLKDPENIYDLATFGIKNSIFGTNIIAEILEQMYNTKNHKILVSIDEFNYLYRPSDFPSFRYENSKELKGRIPPYHLALCRLFIKFDGHLIKNGFKICSSSTKTLYKHEFNPKKINFPLSCGFELKGLEYDDFKNYLLYCFSKGIYDNDTPTEKDIQYCYMECQGNWSEAELGFKYPSLRLK